jgi:hypothetical protein
MSGAIYRGYPRIIYRRRYPRIIYRRRSLVLDIVVVVFAELISLIIQYKRRRNKIHDLHNIR